MRDTQLALDADMIEEAATRIRLVYGALPVCPVVTELNLVDITNRCAQDGEIEIVFATRSYGFPVRVAPYEELPGRFQACLDITLRTERFFNVRDVKIPNKVKGFSFTASYRATEEVRAYYEMYRTETTDVRFTVGEHGLSYLTFI